MQENLQSKFQSDLQKFKNEITKRRERIKKFDAYMSNQREHAEFRFLRLRQKRE